ncbi:hypothetical protein ACHAQE_011115 [Botrytis cinerea]
MNASVVEAYLAGPALAPPPGVESDLTRPHSISKYDIPVVSLALFLCTIIVSARLLTKRFVIRVVGWEDYFLIMSYVLFVGYCVPNVMAREDSGDHQWNTTVKNLFKMLQYCYIGQAIYAPTILFLKISILLQYQRIFIPSRQGSLGTYIAIHAIIWANVVFYTLDMLLELFSCTPREYFWNKLLADGKCLDTGAVIISAAAINVVSDFVILLLPMPTIWKLHTPQRRKAGLTIVFGTGLFVCITSIMRLYYSVLLSTTSDVTWYMTIASYWAFAEIAAGIICCCLPTMPKLFQVMIPKLSQISGKYTSPMASTFGAFNSGSAKTTAETGGKDTSVDTWSGLPRNANAAYYELNDWQDSRRNLCTTAVVGNGSRENAVFDVENQGHIVQTLSVEIVKKHNDKFSSKKVGLTD